MIKPKALNLIKDAIPLPPPYLSLEMGGGSVRTFGCTFCFFSTFFFKRITTSFLTQPRVLFPYRS